MTGDWLPMTGEIYLTTGPVRALLKYGVFPSRCRLLWRKGKSHDRSVGEPDGKSLDREVKEFSTSIPEDFLLYKYDLWGSAAHCKMLEKAGIISEKESQEILRGLRVIFQEIEEGKIDPSPLRIYIVWWKSACER